VVRESEALMNNSINVSTDLSSLRSTEDVDERLAEVESAISTLNAFSELLRGARSFFEASGKHRSETSALSLSRDQSFRSAVLAVLQNAGGRPLSIKQIWDTLHEAGLKSTYDRPEEQVSATLANLKSRGEGVENVERGIWAYTGRQ
jgi:hypothetical protein